MFKSKEKRILDKKGGFALLFAVLTASLLLTIGMAIFNTSFKELEISTAARESQIAFYAADSARECALYWDVKKGYFPTYIDSSSNTTLPAQKGITSCNGRHDDFSSSNVPTGSRNITWTSASTSPFMAYSYSGLAIDPLSPQSDVIVSKTFVSPNIRTTITAYGHNVSASGRRLERGISQTY